MNFDSMWLPPDRDPRTEETPPRGERECVVAYLERYRTTLELKCEDLTPEQLATRSVPPSTLSLLGLLRHMAGVEQWWFRQVVEGRRDEPSHYAGDGEAGGFEWHGDADEELVDEAWRLWRREVAHAREVLAATDLDRVVEVHDERVEVRDIVVHMVEEYARHCGHADLLRECLDGRTGQ